MSESRSRCPITQVTKRTYLLAETASLENLVATLHEDSVLERMGLEDRLSDVTAELASLEAAPRRAAESELVFYGAPELEAALAMRLAGADAKALRRVLRRIEELLDE